MVLYRRVWWVVTIAWYQHNLCSSRFFPNRWRGERKTCEASNSLGRASEGKKARRRSSPFFLLAFCAIRLRTSLALRLTLAAVGRKWLLRRTRTISDISVFVFNPFTKQNCIFISFVAGLLCCEERASQSNQKRNAHVPCHWSVKKETSAIQFWNWSCTGGMLSFFLASYLKGLRHGIFSYFDHRQNCL